MARWGEAVKFAKTFRHVEWSGARQPRHQKNSNSLTGHERLTIKPVFRQSYKALGVPIQKFFFATSFPGNLTRVFAGQNCSVVFRYDVAE